LPTQIEFHFNAPSKLAYACRLVRKAVSQGQRLFVVAEPDFLDRLDSALWAVSPHDFVSHCVGLEDAMAANHSSVILAPQLVSLPGVKTAINLGPEVPTPFETFERLIEVVSDDPSDRAEARARWKAYSAQGYTLIRKDLNLKPSV
jgi:DNA polymerase-3 subunit chi